MESFTQFCVNWGKEIVKAGEILPGHKNEQLYAICCALAQFRIYEYSSNDSDIWRFPLSHVDDVAKFYYNAFIDGTITEVLKL